MLKWDPEVQGVPEDQALAAPEDQGQAPADRAWGREVQWAPA